MSGRKKRTCIEKGLSIVVTLFESLLKLALDESRSFPVSTFAAKLKSRTPSGRRRESTASLVARTSRDKQHLQWTAPEHGSSRSITIAKKWRDEKRRNDARQRWDVEEERQGLQTDESRRDTSKRTSAYTGERKNNNRVVGHQWNLSCMILVKSIS